MKTNTEALVAALRQADDGEYAHHDPGADVRIDGYWEEEPLNGALDTHLVPLSSIVKEQHRNALYLRTGIAEGETYDGRPFELSVLASGRALVFTIGKFESEERRTQMIGFDDLIEAWLRINEADR